MTSSNAAAALPGDVTATAPTASPGPALHARGHTTSGSPDAKPASPSAALAHAAEPAAPSQHATDGNPPTESPATQVHNEPATDTPDPTATAPAAPAAKSPSPPLHSANSALVPTQNASATPTPAVANPDDSADAPSNAPPDATNPNSAGHPELESALAAAAAAAPAPPTQPDNRLATDMKTEPAAPSLFTAPGNTFSPTDAAQSTAEQSSHDRAMMSPPTVSPLSTPAHTHINIDDVPENDTELAGPRQAADPAEASELTQGNPTQNMAASAALQSDWSSALPADSMDIDDPDISQLHRQRQMQDQMQAIATTDPEPEGRYSSQNFYNNLRHTGGNVDPNALMNALAQASTAQFNADLPNIIAPSEVSLAASYNNSSSNNNNNNDEPVSRMTPEVPAVVAAAQKLESFARLEFADSTFQMTTYAVILGRDQRAMNQARADEKRQASWNRRIQENERLGLPPPAPPTAGGNKFSKSYVSEEGGMLGPESDGEGNPRPTKKRRTSSANRSLNGDPDVQGEVITSNRQYVAHTPGAAAVELGNLQPSADHIPFLGIHSPGPDIASKTRGISRQHLKIQFDEKKGVFEAIALHRNGFFVENRHQGMDRPPIVLKSGDHVQIKDVEFAFLINGVEVGKTGGEELHEDDEASSKRLSIGGKEMSFDFEHSDHDRFQDTSEDASPPRAAVKKEPTPVPSPIEEESAGSPMEMDIVHETRSLPEPSELSEVPPTPATPDVLLLAETSPPTVEPAQEAHPQEHPAPEVFDAQTVHSEFTGTEISSTEPYAGMSSEELALAGLANHEVMTSGPAPVEMPELPMPEQVPQVPAQPPQQMDDGYQELHALHALQEELRREHGSEFVMPDIPKRRGPGRPPKDGIMSKRERRLLKKQLQETSKKTIPQEPQGEKIKRPVGRPRKNPLPEDGALPEKRKYTKRKREDGDEGGSDAEKRAREKKDKKVRPKSPPLELRREDFTEDQLQKPSRNYGVLIDEALTNGPPDGLTLKQIYKRIMARYPWFYFSAETKGWESSVRHNLIGNEAFKKAEDTSLWSRVPGVELDAGKKRKASSPTREGSSSQTPGPQPQQPYFQGGPYLAAQQNMGFSSGLQQSPDAKQQQQQQQPYLMPSTPSQQNPHASKTFAPQTPAPAQLPPNYGATPLARQQGAAGQTTYNSPYARPPPPPANTPIKAEPSTQTSQAPSTSGPQHVTQPGPAEQAEQRSQQPRQNVASSSNAAEGSSSISPHDITPELQVSINNFKNTVLHDLIKVTSDAELIIDGAISRATGVSSQSTVPAGFEIVEKTLLQGLDTIIKAHFARHPSHKEKRTTTSASPAPAHNAAGRSTATASPAPHSLAEAEIQRRIKGFRDSIIVTFSKRTDQAEAIVDSAINRAQGLPNVGSFKGWEEADRLMFESVSKIIADARKTHGMSSQPSPAVSTPPTRSAQPAQPSASPAPVQPATPLAQSSNAATAPGPGSSTPAPGTPRPASSSVGRPGFSVPRPTSMGITRPGMSRPPVARKDSGSQPAQHTAGSTPTAAPSPAPGPPAVPSPSPAQAQVRNQAPAQAPAPMRSPAQAPAAPVTAQGPARAPAQLAAQTQPATSSYGQGSPAARIHPQSGPKPTTTPAAGPARAIQPATPSHTAVNNHAANRPLAPQRPTEEANRNVSSPAPPSAGVLDQITGHKRGSDSYHHADSKHPYMSSSTAMPSCAPLAPTLAPRNTGPAKPSAGVLDQITNGQQRQLDNTPKLSAQSTPSAGVLEQIAGHRAVASDATAKHSTATTNTPRASGPTQAAASTLKQGGSTPNAGSPKPASGLAKPQIPGVQAPGASRPLQQPAPTPQPQAAAGPRPPQPTPPSVKPGTAAVARPAGTQNPGAQTAASSSQPTGSIRPPQATTATPSTAAPATTPGAQKPIMPTSNSQSRPNTGSTPGAAPLVSHGVAAAGSTPKASPPIGVAMPAQGPRPLAQAPRPLAAPSSTPPNGLAKPAVNPVAQMPKAPLKTAPPPPMPQSSASRPPGGASGINASSAAAPGQRPNPGAASASAVAPRPVSTAPGSQPAGSAGAGQAAPKTAVAGQPGPRSAVPGQPGPRPVVSGQPGSRPAAPGQPAPRPVAPGQPGSRPAPAQAIAKPTVAQSSQRPGIPAQSAPRPVGPPAASKPAAPAQPGPRPAVPPQSSARPAVPQSSPRPPTAAQPSPRPAAASHPGPRPAVSAQSAPRPAVPAQTAPKPAVSAQTTSRPPAPIQAAPKPTTPAQAASRPAPPAAGAATRPLPTAQQAAGPRPALPASAAPSSTTTSSARAPSAAPAAPAAPAASAAPGAPTTRPVPAAPAKPAASVPPAGLAKPATPTQSASSQATRPPAPASTATDKPSTGVAAAPGTPKVGNAAPSATLSAPATAAKAPAPSAATTGQTPTPMRATPPSSTATPPSKQQPAPVQTTSGNGNGEKPALHPTAAAPSHLPAKPEAAK